jgi:putative 4-mercaptohistidine N1-methyltranferase
MQHATSGNVYETERMVADYLLFHYGTAEQVSGGRPVPLEGLGFVNRVVRQGFLRADLGEGKRVLDLGCAVGGASFELARFGATVVGVDLSGAFIEAAREMRKEGRVRTFRTEEGLRRTAVELARPCDEAVAARVEFRRGDAMALDEDLEELDAVLMANLVDRLPAPRRCLAEVGRRVRQGGVVVVTSPYTWMADYALVEEWLAGGRDAGESGDSAREIGETLGAEFSLERRMDVPFLIREHARKFQWSEAELTVWRKGV